jgi:hypothetical protein
MNTLTCANPDCTDALHADSDHVRVEAESKRMQDRNDVEEYYFHPGCWLEVAGEWEDPA